MCENAERAGESSTVLSGSFVRKIRLRVLQFASRQPALTVFASEKFVAVILSSVSSA